MPAKGQAHALTRSLTGCRNMQLATKSHQRRVGPPFVDYVRQGAIRTRRWPKAPLIRPTTPILPKYSRYWQKASSPQGLMPAWSAAAPEECQFNMHCAGHLCRTGLPDSRRTFADGKTYRTCVLHASVAPHPSEVACQPRGAKAAQSNQPVLGVRA